ncbi:MAG TPA: sodium:proton exchanger [Firmicutes bacterium]|nr:sodium:proton exchanger [Bacillota bacterium]
MGLLLIQYFALAFLVVFSSIRISECVDELDKRTKLGGALIGGILLAGVTSLPELITSLSSTMMLNNPDLALGNILGSNAFNVFILAVGNIIFFKHMMFNHTKTGNAKTNFINVIIYILILITFYSVTIARVGHVGVTSICIFVLYYINLKIATNNDEEEHEVRQDQPNDGSFSWLIFRFICWACVIVGTSMLVSITTDRIAQATGIGSSFVGAIFLGVATSLPETTSLISLIRLRNYDMAIGNIVGSNLFNFGVIALTDFLYFSGNIFEIADVSNTLLVTVGLCEAMILLYILLKKRMTNVFIYSLPSFGILAIYSYYLYVSLK